MTLPTTVTDYRVTTKSPADELFTLGRIFSEVGGYASTIWGKDSLSLAKYCDRRLSKIVKELQSRNLSIPPFSLITHNSALTNSPSSLSIDELHALYCNRQERQKKRVDQGREPLTYWYERHIVEELSRRTPSTTGEQLKIDYCRLTYRNDIENLASIYGLPVHSHKTGAVKSDGSNPVGSWPATPTEHRPLETPSELLIEIDRLKHYADITTRERLVEYVDRALDLILSTGSRSSAGLQPLLGLIAELMEIGRKGLLTVPDNLPGLLTQGIKDWRKRPLVTDTEVILPLLTLHLHTADPRHERLALRLLRRSWRLCLSALKEIETTSQAVPVGSLPATPSENQLSVAPELIDHLFITVYCSDYLPLFSPRRAALLLTRLKSLSTPNINPSSSRINPLSLTPTHLHRLHLISSELTKTHEIFLTV